MAVLTCPICGSAVRYPHATSHVEMACAKCHSTFHLDRSSRPVVGKPPDVERDVEALKRKARSEIKRFPVEKVVVGLVIVVLGWLSMSYLWRPADSLTTTAERAVRAFAEDDVDYLKSIATSGTVDDVGRWYETTHPGLVNYRERWHGKKEVVEVGIAREDPVMGRGSTLFSIRPGLGNARDVSLANPAQTTEGADGSFDAQIAWVLLPSGHWKINGRATYARVRPRPPVANPEDLSKASAGGRPPGPSPGVRGKNKGPTRPAPRSRDDGR